MKQKNLVGLLVAATLAAGVFAACGGGEGDGTASNQGRPTGQDGGNGAADSGPDSSHFDLDAETPAVLRIKPEDPTLDVTGGPATLKFEAFVDGSTTPSQATWSVDMPSIGAMDGAGLFTASGLKGAKATVSAQVGNLTAQTTITVRLHLEENPGSVDPKTQAQLEAGGAADPGFKWLYPYDKTVFPRGLLPPTLMFASTADAYLVRVTSKFLDYKGFFPGTDSRVTWAPSVWEAISQSAGSAADPLSVEVTKISGGAVTGPSKESWIIAEGSLTGTVYYNSYSSTLAGNTGAVLRIKPGASVPEVMAGGCHVCHSVSADGSTLIASRSDYASGELYQLKTGDTGVRVQSDPSFSFGALYPDGSLVMTNGGSVPGTTPRTSQLMDPATGAVLPAPGWDSVITRAVTPSFSPDGAKIAFSHVDTSSGHSLAAMDFDRSTNTFSNLVDFATDPARFLGWPSFTPDGDWVVYHGGNRGDFATWQSGQADLYIAHLPSKTTARLDALDGYAGGVSYLPYPNNENDLNYEPTILPVAVGGYYWVVFTSRRHYGNMIVHEGPEQTDRKKLWVAAIDINVTGDPKAQTSAYDASHPAFYLPGQELSAGNMRGFWALDPCRADGDGCDTGDECCSGFCRRRQGEDGGQLPPQCVPPPTDGCSNELEACTTTADCCGASSGIQCINSHCAQPTIR